VQPGACPAVLRAGQVTPTLYREAWGERRHYRGEVTPMGWWWMGSRTDRGRALRKRGRTRSVRRGVHVPQRQCPRCGYTQIRPSRQWRWWEGLLRAIHLYPFRCEDCNHRFLRFSLRGR
jgi:hypothetical protein